jgi:hypothetical protein
VSTDQAEQQFRAQVAAVMEVGFDLTESLSSDTDLDDLHKHARWRHGRRCRLVMAWLGRCPATVL